jgi:hypothetical protein
VGLLLHDLEPGAGDQLGDGATQLRARGRVAAAGSFVTGLSLRVSGGGRIRAK